VTTFFLNHRKVTATAYLARIQQYRETVMQKVLPRAS
jgi:hypothetical protein